jgi:hypothetical protein
MKFRYLSLLLSLIFATFMNFLGYLSFLVALIFAIIFIICMVVQQAVAYHNILGKARKFSKRINN